MTSVASVATKFGDRLQVFVKLFRALQQIGQPVNHPVDSSYDESNAFRAGIYQSSMPYL